jgi:hypothetical protein
MACALRARVANDGRSRRQYVYNPRSQLLLNREPVGLSIPQLDHRIGTPKSATERLFCSTERQVKTTSGKKRFRERPASLYRRGLAARAFTQTF